MAQWAKVLVATPGNLNSIPGTYLHGRDNQLLKAVF